MKKIIYLGLSFSSDWLVARKRKIKSTNQSIQTQQVCEVK